MAIKAKAAAAITAVGVLLLGSLAIAAGPGKKKAPAKAPPKKTNGEAPNPDSDDIVIEVPDAPAAPPVVVKPEEIPEAPEAPEAPAHTVPLPAGPAGVTLPSHTVPLTQADADIQAVSEATGVPVTDVAVVAVEKASGLKPSPLAVEELKPENDPSGTIALARKMLAREEAQGWKGDLKASVKAWQSRVELKPDGLFGPGSAARMAEEVGILPLVRYWPKGTTTRKGAVKLFKSMMGEVAAKLEPNRPITGPHLDALAQSVAREKAAAWGTDNPPAQKSLDFAEGVLTKLAAKAEAEGAAALEA